VTRKVRGQPWNGADKVVDQISHTATISPQPLGLAQTFPDYIGLGDPTRPCFLFNFVEESLRQSDRHTFHDSSVRRSWLLRKTNRTSESLREELIYAYPSSLKNFDAAGRADYAWYLERTGYILAATGALQFGY
jgi:hypothetical protein